MTAPPPPQVTLVGKVVTASESGGGIQLRVSDSTGEVDVRAYVEDSEVRFPWVGVDRGACESGGVQRDPLFWGSD